MTSPIKSALDLLHSHPEFAGLFQATEPRVVVVLRPNWETLKDAVYQEGRWCESCGYLKRWMERHGEFREVTAACTVEDDSDCPGVEAALEANIAALKSDYGSILTVYTVDGEKAEIIKKLAED